MIRRSELIKGQECTVLTESQMTLALPRGQREVFARMMERSLLLHLAVLVSKSWQMRKTGYVSC